MDIFTDKSTFFGILFAYDSNEVILYLEGSSQRFYVLNNFLFLNWINRKYSRNKSNTHTWKTTGFVNHHLKILLFSWHDVSIMPMNIPVLSKMNVYHFFWVNFEKFVTYFRVLYEFFEFWNWCVVHQSSSINCVINTIFKICAWLATSHQTFVFKIINH